MRHIIAILAIALTASVLPAQGWVRLKDGTRISGDVIYDSKSAVEIIDMLGRCHRFDKEDEVDKVSIGKKLAKSTLALLEDVDDGDPDAIYAVALKVLETRSGKSDGERLLRRVLALDETYEGVREKLGQVQALDQWFEDEKDAQKAIDAHYESEGYIKFKKGWLRSEQEAEIKANEKDWMIHGGIWQPLEKVMTARNYVEFRGEWLPPEQADYARYAAIIEDEGGLKMEGAQVGTVVVLHYRGEEYSKKLAKLLMDGRTWFAQNYEQPVCALQPIALEIVIEKKADWLSVTNACRATLDISSPGDSSRGEVSGLGYMSILGTISHDEFTPPPLPPGAVMARDVKREDFQEAHGMINSMAFGLMMSYWDKDEPHNIPYWIARAASVHTEISVLGTTRVMQATEEENYDRSGRNEFGGNIESNLDDLKKKLKETMKRRRISLRTMFFASGTQLDGETDQYCVTFLNWMQEKHRDKLISMLREKDLSMAADEVFKKHFGEAIEVVEKEFLAWLGV